jgi:hypothetical protein
MPGISISENAPMMVCSEGPNCPRKAADYFIAYTSYNTFDLVFDTVLRVTSRVFVGGSICRDQRWYDEIAAYQTDVALVVVALFPFPDFFRPFIAPLVPFKWRLNRIHTTVRELLFPDRGTIKGPVSEGTVSLVKFFIQNSKDGCQETIVAQILVLLSAAVGTHALSIRGMFCNEVRSMVPRTR